MVIPGVSSHSMSVVYVGCIYSIALTRHSPFHRKCETLTILSLNAEKAMCAALRYVLDLSYRFKFRIYFSTSLTLCTAGTQLPAGRTSNGHKRFSKGSSRENLQRSLLAGTSEWRHKNCNRRSVTSRNGPLESMFLYLIVSQCTILMVALFYKAWAWGREKI